MLCEDAAAQCGSNFLSLTNQELIGPVTLWLIYSRCSAVCLPALLDKEMSPLSDASSLIELTRIKTCDLLQVFIE